MSSSNDTFDPKLYEKYASARYPETINNISDKDHYVRHTDHTITIHELYGKSKMHFIMIPRVKSPPRVPANLKDLHTWLSSPEVTRQEAEQLLREMRKDAEDFIENGVKEEMQRREGYVSKFWVGFKAKSSYKYLQLHILSDDLMGGSMKEKKHFFKFHPHHGDFYSIDKVLGWFEIVEDKFQDNLRELRRKARNPPPLPTELECYHMDPLECTFSTNSFSDMKAHLEGHAEEAKNAYIKRQRNREKIEELKARINARKEREAKEQEAKEQGDKERSDVAVENPTELDVL